MSFYRRLECKCRSEETPGATHKTGLGVQNEAGQRLIEFCQENALVIANTLFQQHKSPYGSATPRQRSQSPRETLKNSLIS